MLRAEPEVQCDSEEEEEEEREDRESNNAVWMAGENGAAGVGKLWGAAVPEALTRCA